MTHHLDRPFYLLRSLELSVLRSARHAVEFFLAGASAVVVGTALFVAPATPIKIADGLSAYLQQRGLQHVSELTGQMVLPE